MTESSVNPPNRRCPCNPPADWCDVHACCSWECWDFKADAHMPPPAGPLILSVPAADIEFMGPGHLGFDAAMADAVERGLPGVLILPQEITFPDEPRDPLPVIAEGPWNVLRALASGDPIQTAAALAAQRESFRAQFGCYPDEMREVCPACPTDLGTEQAERCPIWLSMREQLDADETMATRERLEAEHNVADIPCVTCGALTGCNIFHCYGGQ